MALELAHPNTNNETMIYIMHDEVIKSYYDQAGLDYQQKINLLEMDSQIRETNDIYELRSAVLLEKMKGNGEIINWSLTRKRSLLDSVFKVDKIIHLEGNLLIPFQESGSRQAVRKRRRDIDNIYGAANQWVLPVLQHLGGRSRKPFSNDEIMDRIKLMIKHTRPISLLHS